MTACENKSTAEPARGKRPLGRPRKFDPDQALETALEYFWKNGMRTTTRELEQTLGLSQSSIYNTFGSKLKLLESALARYEQLADAQLLRPLTDTEDGLEAIDRFFVTLKQWVTQGDHRGCMLINLMAEDGGNTQEIVVRARGYRERVRAALKQALQRAAATGETFAGDIDGRAELLMCLVLGLNISARGGASQSELDRLIDSVQTHIESWRLTAAA